MHGGPFANIAHGCNSAIATQSALHLADYVVTEAGFGADLGAEKFIDILCRTSGLRPSAAVIVATVRAMKYHGGVDVADLPNENVRGARARHRQPRPAPHHRARDLGPACRWWRSTIVPRTRMPRSRLSSTRSSGPGAGRWWRGTSPKAASGAEELAREVVRLCAEASDLRFTYPDSDGLWQKMRAIATRIYGASDITASTAVRAQIRRLQDEGYGDYPVCVAKTQYSFSTDPKLRGAPSGHDVDIREVRLAAGARFVVMICGDIMTMPGLPATPAANTIDVDEQGRIVGLF